jgi:hypothetical protein
MFNQSQNQQTSVNLSPKLAMLLPIVVGAIAASAIVAAPAHAAPKKATPTTTAPTTPPPTTTTPTTPPPTTTTPTTPPPTTTSGGTTVASSISSTAAALAGVSVNTNLGCGATLFGYTQCAGSFALGGGQNDVTNGGASNIATKMLNEGNLFGSNDWTFGNKFDGGLASSNNSAGFNVSNLGSTSGSFGFTNLDLSKNDLVVSLKSAKGFSLYYFKAGSITNPSQIQWNTAGTSVNGGGAAQGLSHISYYTRLVSVTPPPVTRVPEPSTIAALSTIALAAAMKRRQMNRKG